MEEPRDRDRFGCLMISIIIILIVILTAIFFGCTKDDALNSYICKGTFIRSAPGYLSDTTLYEIKKIDVSYEDIMFFEDNRTYTLYEIWNGIPITTTSTMDCKLATCTNTSP
jgi:hypothetical protein